MNSAKEQKGKQGDSFCPCLAQKMGDSMSSRLSEEVADRLAMGEPRDQVDIQKGAVIPGAQAPEASSGHTVEASMSSLKAKGSVLNASARISEIIYVRFLYIMRFILILLIFYMYILYTMNIH